MSLVYRDADAAAEGRCEELRAEKSQLQIRLSNLEERLFAPLVESEAIQALRRDLAQVQARNTELRIELGLQMKPPTVPTSGAIQRNADRAVGKVLMRGAIVVAFAFAQVFFGILFEWCR